MTLARPQKHVKKQTRLIIKVIRGVVSQHGRLSGSKRYALLSYVTLAAQCSSHVTVTCSCTTLLSLLQCMSLWAGNNKQWRSSLDIEN